MGLQDRKCRLSDERSGEGAEWIFSDQFQDGILQTGFHGGQKPLPLPSMLVVELLPSVEGSEGDFEHFADPVDGAQTNGVLCQDAKDKEQAVSAVGNDRNRQDRVRGRSLTLMADQTADTQAGLHRMTVNEFDQGAVVVGVDTHASFTATIQTDLRCRTEMVHTFTEMSFSGFFFPD